MTDFVKELSDCRVEGTQLPFYPEKVQGYTEQEVELIAKNLNLDIHGQFRDFLLQIGKCSGGLLLSDEFYMYDYRCEKYFLSTIKKIFKKMIICLIIRKIKSCRQKNIFSIL